jgi:exosortase
VCDTALYGQRRLWYAITALLAAVFLWAYWPTLTEMVATWDREPDYSHGYLVVPIAIAFLWTRRKLFPRDELRMSWLGLTLIAGAVALRVAAGRWYLESVDGWSMLLWLAGTVWLLGGPTCLRWCWPSIAFLIFMVPLPFRVENAMSRPLQRMATETSGWILRCMAQPAVTEGNTILLGEHHLEVEQACSGLRVFMGIAALAFACVLFIRRPLWEKALLVASTVPIAILANSLRIVATGFLYRYVSTEDGRQFLHDTSGWVMIPLAACMFGCLLLYLKRLLREDEVIDTAAMVARGVQ